MKKGISIAIISILTGIILFLSCLIYFKTNLVQRIGVKMGVIESKPQDRADYWCIMGWTNTLKKMNIDFDIVFFGNSITRGSSFHEYFPNKKICNLGYPGDNLDGMLLRIDQIKAVNPTKVFIMAGINGLQYQTLSIFDEKYERLVKLVKEKNPQAEIYLQSILPVNKTISDNRYANNKKIIAANDIIKKIASSNGCTYIDVHSLYYKNGELDHVSTKDGVHLLPQCYDKWAELLKQYIE